MPAPNLVEIPGDVVGSPPYRAEGCLMQAFLFDGDRRAQQILCDRLLNAPSGGALTFKAVTHKVMMSAVYVETMRSLHPLDQNKGVIREWDLGFWTLAFGGATSRPLSWRFYWVPSFLFVDSPSAMAAGREVFGYPKALASWRRAPPAPHEAAVELTVLHYPTFGAAERPHYQVLLKLEPEPAPVAAVARQHDETSAAPVPLDADFWGTTDVPAELLHSAEPIASGLTLSMPQLMLRQVRDGEAPGRASQQHALVVDIAVDAFTGAGAIPGRWTLSLTPSASHAISTTLGLPAVVSTGHAWWVRQDFTVPAARRP